MLDPDQLGGIKTQRLCLCQQLIDYRLGQLLFTGQYPHVFVVLAHDQRPAILLIQLHHMVSAIEGSEEGHLQ